MKVIVHVRQAVEVDIPDSLVPTTKSRYGNNAMQRLAIDSALLAIQSQDWAERQGYGGSRYMSHPALGWIEYPKKEMTSGVI